MKIEAATSRVTVSVTFIISSIWAVIEPAIDPFSVSLITYTFELLIHG